MALRLRDEHEQSESLDQPPNEAVNIGEHPAAFVFVNVSGFGGTCQTLEILTAARNRSADYFTAHTFTLTGTTSTYVYLDELGEYIRYKSQLHTDTKSTWESLVVPKR